MSNLVKKLVNRALRHGRVRSKVIGTVERPRLSVYISNQHIHAQIIDDAASKTLASSTTVGSAAKGSMSEKAAWIGADIAKKAVKAKITKVVLDRSSRKYQGRLKALADAARAGGLEF